MQPATVPVDRPSRPAGGLRRELGLALALLGTLLTLDLLLEILGTWPLADGTPPRIDGALSWWCLWALLTPPLQWGGRHVAHESASGVRVAFGLTSLALVATAAHTAAHGLLFGTLPFNPTLGPFTEQLRVYVGAGILLLQLTTALAILGVAYGVRVSERASARALEAARLRAGLYEERLHNLQRRLAPHFLMNALNSVTGLIQTDRTDEAVRLLARIGRFLRRSLNEAPGAEITLEEELELAEEFRALGAARLDGPVGYTVEVERGLEGARVPPFILQPLLENAMEHGHRGTAELEVRIRARRVDDGRLRLSVEDSGPGWEEPFREGHGLRLTRDALELRYGGSARVERHRSRDLGGARVDLTLPVEWAAPPAAAAPAG